jgi:peptidoglycan/LPS O-acetylase OafA/YrhL
LQEFFPPPTKRPILNGRIPVLDGLRGTAILMVMAFHVRMFGEFAGHSILNRIYYVGTAGGWAGVDLFFVLSGFLITGILFDSRDDPHYFRVFYARRTIRIFPLYYLSLIFFFWIVPFGLRVFNHAEIAPSHTSLITRVLSWSYTVNWYEGLRGSDVVPRWLNHLWSLSIEEQFYMVWPFLVLLIARRRLQVLCLGLMAFALVFRLVLMQAHLPSAVFFWTLSRVDSLAVGAVISLAARDLSNWRTAVKWASYLTLPALCGIALLMSLQFVRPALLPSFIPQQFSLTLLCFLFTFLGLFFGGCLIMAVCSPEGSLQHRFLNSTFLRFFGKYSYCLYICHQPVIVLVTRLGVTGDILSRMLGSELGGIIAMNGIVFATSIVIALMSWNLFEKQWLKLKNRVPLRHGTHRPSVEANV